MPLRGQITWHGMKTVSGSGMTSVQTLFLAEDTGLITAVGWPLLILIRLIGDILLNTDLRPLLPNWHRLFGSYYVVRTQAGFEHALTHYSSDWSRAEALHNLVGYPKSYPSLVHFHTGYSGYHYIVADCHHVNKLKEALKDI